MRAVKIALLLAGFTLMSTANDQLIGQFVGVVLLAIVASLEFYKLGED